MATKQLLFDVLAVAEAKGFAEAGREVDKLSKAADNSAKSFDKQSKSTGLLASALLATGSAAIPFAGAASAALIGAGGAAGVLALAVTGLVKDWKAGTLQGTQFAGQVKLLQTNFGKLQQTAAAGVLPGVTAALKAVNKQTPELNNDVRVLSGQLGAVASHVVPTFLTGLHQLSPVMENLGTTFVSGSKRLQQWASSTDSIRTFGAYAENQLPLVNQTIANVGVTAGHAIEALAPFGSTLVKGVNAFSAATRAIPLGALQTALPILAGAKIGSTLGKSAQQSEGLIGKFAKTSSLAGKVVSNLGVAGLAAGLALGGLSAVMGVGERNAAKYRAQVDKVTQALQNGSSAQAAWVAAQNTGADAATKLGLSQKQVIAQIEQGQKATGAYTGKINDLKSQELALQKTLYSQQKTYGDQNQITQATAKQLQDVIGQLDVLTGKASKSGAEFAAAKKQLAAWASTQGDAALAAEITSGKFIGLAKSLGIQAGDYVQAKAAADANTASMRASTAVMILENNAAGLLDQALQKLGGNNLGVAQATTAAATANAAAAKAFHDNGTTLDQNTEKGRANETALQGQASAAQQLAKSIEQNTGSTVKGNAALADQKHRLEDSLRSQGRLNPAVQAYINYLYKIPARKETAIDIKNDAANAKIRALQAKIDAIRQHKAPGVEADTAAGKAKIAALQAQINAITQGRVPGINANTNAGKAKVASLQDQINTIRQRKIPTLSVSAATAMMQVLDLQRQIAALHNRTVQITVQQQQIGLQSQRVRAAGGPVTKGVSYLVGEKRPEIFTPGANGYITPRVPSSWVTGRASVPGGQPAGSATTVNVVNVTVQAGAIANPAEFRRLLISELERAFASGETVAGGQRAMR